MIDKIVDVLGDVCVEVISSIVSAIIIEEMKNTRNILKIIITASKIVSYL